MAKETVAILGGTGEQGLGLAYRFALAGRPVRIGSRKQDRALEAMRDVAAKVPGADVSGHENAAAVREARGGIVILSVPFEHVAGTLKSVKEELVPGTVLVSMGVPLDVKPIRLSPVGRYALQFEWSDGHDSGIYTYEYLRELCPCCTEAAQASK